VARRHRLPQQLYRARALPLLALHTAQRLAGHHRRLAEALDVPQARTERLQLLFLALAQLGALDLGDLVS
jgi:hypothetical protein